MKSRSPVFLSTIVAALGGLLFGFDTAVISGTTGALQLVFGLDAFSLGFTVASALIGTIVGAFAVGQAPSAEGVWCSSACWALSPFSACPRVPPSTRVVGPVLQGPNGNIETSFQTLDDVGIDYMTDGSISASLQREHTT